MKTWTKYYLPFLSLAMILCGTFSIKTYAKADKYTEVKQLEENLKIAETVEVYGSGTLQGAYAMENYPDKVLFTPAYIGSNTSKINPESKFIVDFETILGLKKTTYFNGEDILLNTELNLNKQGEVRIKKLYAKSKNWIVGLYPSNFSTPDLLPNTIAGLPGAALSKSKIQITYKKQITPKLSYSLGLEEPNKWDMHPELEQKEKETRPKKPNTGIPTFAAKLAYNYPDGLKAISLGGLANVVSYYDNKHKQSFNDVAFGISLGAKLSVNKEQTKLMGNAVYGKGIGNYIFDLSLLEKEQNTAYLDNKQTNKIQTLDAWGFYLGLEHSWSSLVRSTISGGFLQTLEDKTHRTNDKHYQYGYSGSFNLTYHPAEQFYFGVEFAHGNRRNLNNKDTNANCIQTIAAFKF